MELSCGHRCGCGVVGPVFLMFQQDTWSVEVKEGTWSRRTDNLESGGEEPLFQRGKLCLRVMSLGLDYRDTIFFIIKNSAR